VVTKRQLQAETRAQEKEEQEKKCRMKEAHAKWLAETEAKAMDQANKLLDGKLGSALKRWNKEGHRQIKLSSNKVWDAITGSEFYSDDFSLNIQIEPGYAPIETLVANLKKAGFKAQIIAEEHGNVEWQHDGDGMGPVRVPGTHTEYRLLIDWR